MDYTQSDAFSTDVATGNRMHQDSAAVTTEVSAQDMNGITWELLSLIVGSGQAPIPFDKTNPASYTQVYQGVLSLINAGIAAAMSSDYKTSVRYTTTGNIVLSGLGTQAGGDWPAALNPGDRILSKDQTTGSENGIYIAAAGAWTRATDADGVGELTSGAFVSVEEGTTLANSLWMLITDGAITIGTTPLAFARKDVPPGLLAPSGYQKLPGGFIVQWGFINSATVSAIYPIAFPTGTLIVLPQADQNNVNPVIGNTVFIASSNTTGFTRGASGVGLFYIAIGY